MSSLNYSLVVEDIKQRVKTGLLDNVEQEVAHDVRHLLKRVEELEKALFPFAKVGQLNNFGDELVNVYHKDTLAATAVLDRQNAFTVRNRSPQDVRNYYPAE